MFEDVRQALHDLLHGNVAPEDRRALLVQMRETLVQAKMALDDLRKGVEVTCGRLTRERRELETVLRRKGLAEGIGDAETVAIAARYETHHSGHVALLEKKLEAEEAELLLVEGEVTEMQDQYKSAMAGVGSGRAGGSMPNVDDIATAGGAQLKSELDNLDRARRRAATEADAAERLAELKRRMGK